MALCRALHLSPIRDSYLIGELSIYQREKGGVTLAESIGTVRRMALALVLCGLGLLQGAGAAYASGTKASVNGPKAAVVSTSPKAVVELFTSQGCSSCPAADAMLAKLAARDDLIAISLSVDLWDYLGWRDTLAQAKFSDRQKAYAKVLGDGMVYTPQMVINGRAHVNGGDALKIDHAIEETSSAFAASRVPIQLTVRGNRLLVEIGPEAQAGAKDATVWLAVVSKTVSVPIERGENKGKTITYNNVVRDLMPIGTWHGKTLAVELDRHAFMHKHADSCAVLVQQGRGGAIIGAALLSSL